MIKLVALLAAAAFSMGAFAQTTAAVPAPAAKPAAVMTPAAVAAPATPSMAKADTKPMVKKVAKHKKAKKSLKKTA